MNRILKIIRKIFRKNNVFFVGATDILPPPLSKEEEDYFLELKEKGDKHAKDKLIEHNLRLVVFLAKRYENTKVDLEDLVSIGSIGLIKGINTYKRGKNIKLATYCSRCIDNEILMYLRKNKKTKTDISFEESLSFDSDGNELHLEDILGTEGDLVFDEFSEKENKITLSNELSTLSDREKLIMTLRYGLNGTDDYTQKEVAEMLGISQSYISRLEKKVVKKLQGALLK